MEALEAARLSLRYQSWERARASASDAIQANPALVEAYMIRAIASRVLDELDAAIADYTRVVELDPQRGEAWLFRGACKTQKASEVRDPARACELLALAHPDYQRAAELKPDDEQVGLALLELEICIGKYREAVATTGLWWNRIDPANYKLICAWLGAIAFILAGRPEAKWAHFRHLLEQDEPRLGVTDWSVVEISRTLERLASDPGCDRDSLAQARAMHELFLRHFPERGPAIR
jgi:tetratricopeptide (TPR) repeat protein